MLRSTEDVHAVRAYFARSHCVHTAAVPPRLKMTEFREVEKRRQTENYTHTANFIPQQKTKWRFRPWNVAPQWFLKWRSPPALPFLSCLTYSTAKAGHALGNPKASFSRFTKNKPLSSSISSQWWTLSRSTCLTHQRALMIVISKWLKWSVKAFWGHSHKHTEAATFFSAVKRKHFLSLGPWDQQSVAGRLGFTLLCWAGLNPRWTLLRCRQSNDWMIDWLIPPLPTPHSLSPSLVGTPSVVEITG